MFWLNVFKTLYHHMDDATDFNGDKNRSAIFMIAKNEGAHTTLSQATTS
jgi:hypothetical protein